MDDAGRRGNRIRKVLMSGALALVAATSAFLPLTPRSQAQVLISQTEALAALKRCAQCHGPSLQMSNLDLSTREGMLKGGEKGPALVPGHSEASPLYRRVAGLEAPAMPMKPVAPLTVQEVALLKAWIDQGAKWDSAPISVSSSTSAKPDVGGDSPTYPGGYKPRPITAEHRQWWAFQKPVRHAVPGVSDARWGRNPIDGFIRSAQIKKGLEVAPEADRRTLIRRAYLDLIGLLPPPEAVDAFVNDASPDAYEKLIDRLLASPNYGERWGRFWLDVVRYADSSGFEYNKPIDNAWRYRDYVIRAFNQDKPFNQFVVEQLAGDELDQPTDESLIATTYYRLGPRVRHAEKVFPYYRYDYMDDMVRTTFQGFMGLSVNCARCHDHKFDPITRLDYYKAVSAFWGYVDYDHPLAPKAKVDEYNATLAALGNEMTPILREIARIERPYRLKERAEKEAEAFAKYPSDIQLAMKTPEAERTPGQKLLVAQMLAQAAVGPPIMDPDKIVADPAAMAKEKARLRAYSINGGKPRVPPTVKLDEADEKKRADLQEMLKEIENRIPSPLPVADGVRDGDFRAAPDGPGDSEAPGTGRPDYGVKCCFLPEAGTKYEVPPLYFAAKGEDLKFDASTFQVQPGFLTVLSTATWPPVTHAPNRSDYVTSGRRRALAEAIASEQNPLTARVIVNRIWGWHFGTGIVSTPGNFGKMGMPPSNPELLDWLATEFVRQGWSIKQMHRLIMNSETYKMQSAFSRESNLKADPTNVSLWRFPPHRVEVEVIRDLTLSASGQLNPQFGGEPYYPPMPASVRAAQPRAYWPPSDEGPQNWRRGVYAAANRGLKHPMYEVFDQPDLNLTTERRVTTTVPTQALTLLNNDFSLIQANYFADRVWNVAGRDPEKQIREMYRIALSREPSSAEMRSNLAFLKTQAENASAKDEGGSSARSALKDLAHVTLNLNEFVYVR